MSSFQSSICTCDSNDAIEHHFTCEKFMRMDTPFVTKCFNCHEKFEVVSVTCSKCTIEKTPAQPTLSETPSSFVAMQRDDLQAALTCSHKRETTINRKKFDLKNQNIRLRAILSDAITDLADRGPVASALLRRLKYALQAENDV